MRSLRCSMVALLIVALPFLFPAQAVADSFENGVQALYEGDFAKAADHFSQALADSPFDFALYLWRARAYLGTQDYDKAGDDYAQAISLNPADPDGYIGRGSTLLWKKDYDKALEDFSKAIQV